MKILSKDTNEEKIQFISFNCDAPSFLTLKLMEAPPHAMKLNYDLSFSHFSKSSQKYFYIPDDNG